MPSIDVSDILADTFIAGEPFTVTRRAETVNVHGESTVSTATLSGSGSIVPTGNNSLLREEAFQTGAGTIRVITTFRLRDASQAGGQNYQPDIVVWKGGNYIVRTVEDYTQFGAGMVIAECSSIDFIDQAPT